MHDDVSALDLSRAKVSAGVDVGARGVAAAVSQRPHVRLLHGMRRPANWLQLIQFGMVGGLGFVINLGVFSLCERGIGIPYLLAYGIAWLIAVSNNFLFNRRFTFNEHANTSRIHFQAIRFVLVSAIAAAFGALLLALLVEVGGIAKVPAEALAVAASTPLNFLGNKLWSFRPSIDLR